MDVWLDLSSDVWLDVWLDLSLDLLADGWLDPSDVWLDLLDPSVRSEKSVLDFADGETTCGMPVMRFEILISVSSFDLASVKFQACMDWATVKFGGFTLPLRHVLAAISCLGSLLIGFCGIVSE